MKELDFEKDLGNQIKNSKKFKGMSPSILDGSILLGATALGVVGVGFLGLQTAALTWSIIMAGYCVYTIGRILYITIKSVKGDRSISSLSKMLESENVKVNDNAILKSLCKEKSKEIINYDNKTKVDTNNEIIKHFYMLDEDEQIVVLRETLKTSKSEDGSYSEVRNLFLLEDEDKKEIEMPNVVKRLTFKNNK